jgi:hypothetical protein
LPAEKSINVKVENTSAKQVFQSEYFHNDATKHQPLA